MPAILYVTGLHSCAGGAAYQKNRRSCAWSSSKFSLMVWSPLFPSAILQFSTPCISAQVRQHTEHKRTFLYLEQLILKHNADANCVSIKNIHEVSTFCPDSTALCEFWLVVPSCWEYKHPQGEQFLFLGPSTVSLSGQLEEQCMPTFWHQNPTLVKRAGNFCYSQKVLC